MMQSKDPDFSRHNTIVLKIVVNFLMSMARRKRIEIAPEFCMDLLGDGHKEKEVDSGLHSIQPTAACLLLLS